MANLLELAGVIGLKGSKIRSNYSAKSGSQEAYSETSYSGDCSECNCDCSQGGDCCETSAECEND